MKFGGASLRNPEAIQQTAAILESYRNQDLLIVVSAMGKTTNALERLSHYAQNRKEAEAWEVYQEIETFHREIGSALFPQSSHPVHEEIQKSCEKIARVLQGILLLEDFPDRTYDKIVANGEMLSSTIVFHYLAHCGFNLQWKDARELIRTDSDYRQAEVNWTHTHSQIDSEVKPILDSHTWVLTQGFIGSNAQGRTTTLGREGSDFSAAIFASCLNAEKLIVWKDVQGIMNADPSFFSDAMILPELSYDQLVRMSYFGASVIHPKTLRPLRNAGIPLLVKSFINPNALGTIVSSQQTQLRVPTWSLKRNQSLIRIWANDFSFIESNWIAYLFRSFDKNGIEALLSWINGMELCLVLDLESVGKLEAFIGAGDQFGLSKEENLTLYSALIPENYDPSLLISVLKGNVVWASVGEAEGMWLCEEGVGAEI